jgi:hypothetical protein
MHGLRTTVTLIMSLAGLAAHAPSSILIISTCGRIACSVTQLPDGQIRLNTNESAAKFIIANGEMLDSVGRVCTIARKSLCEDATETS